MTHNMNLNDSPFRYIKSGKKILKCAYMMIDVKP